MTESQTNVAKINDPSIAVGSIDPSQSPVEQLRSMMRSAPNYRDNIASSDVTERFAYGSFEPDNGETGLVISEKIVPGASAVQKSDNGKDYHTAYDDAPDSVLWDYAYAGMLTSYAEDSGMQGPLEALGYQAHSLQSDEAGSRLITVAFPSDEAFNQKLVEAGIQNLAIGTYESASVERSDRRAAVEAFAEGRFLYSDDAEKLSIVPVFGLLSNELITALQAKSSEALLQTDESLAAGDRNLVHQMYNLLHGGLSIRMFGPNLADVFIDPYSQGDPNNAQKLGYNLRIMLGRDSETLPAESGLPLAVSVINHMRKLVGLSVELAAAQTENPVQELPSGTTVQEGTSIRNRLGGRIGTTLLSRRSR